MPRFPMFLSVILMSCVAFVSCDRAQHAMGPVLPDANTMDASDRMEMETTPVGDPTDGSDPSVIEGPVVINELMADNDTIFADPQGDYDDWVELHNRSSHAVRLTGMYLSDKQDEPTKWRFPENTEIPANGYLIVWLDDDVEAPEGLHANFKLSKNGEAVLLVDTDAQGNRVLDSITFGEQAQDVAFGRLPDGSGDFQVVQATPGAQNMTQ